MIYSLPLDIGGALNNLGNPFKVNDLGGFVSSVVGVGITVAAIACLLYLLWGGFDWLISGGDKGAVENARNKITAALVGLTIVVSIWALFGFVQRFLGINLIGNNPQQNASAIYRCPGPNCDRCPGSTTRPAADLISCSDGLWVRNSLCKTLFPSQAAGCTKN